MLVLGILEHDDQFRQFSSNATESRIVYSRL